MSKLKMPNQITKNVVCFSTMILFLVSPANQAEETQSQYLSNSSKIQWDARSDIFYCIDIFNKDWQMIHQAAACGRGMNSFYPESLNLTDGTYHWKIWTPSLEGTFDVSGQCQQEFTWGTRGNDTLYCIDILDSQGKMVHQAAACGENLHTFRACPLNLKPGSYRWKVWSPSVVNYWEFQSGFEGEFTVSEPPNFVYIYKNADASENKVTPFFPSGFMGDSNDIRLNTNFRDDCYSGDSCIEISYEPMGYKHWAGIYWQYPEDNWGENPGHDLSGATELTFYAKGKSGYEKAEFKVGGLGKIDATRGTGVVTLTKEWKQYRILLKGMDLTNLVGGFVWGTNTSDNPQGSVIYIDDIVFVK